MVPRHASQQSKHCTSSSTLISYIWLVYNNNTSSNEQIAGEMYLILTADEKIIITVKNRDR